MFEPWEDENAGASSETTAGQKTVEEQLDQIIREIKEINENLRKVLTQ